GRRRLERTVLSIPVLGNVVAHFALVRFCRMLGTLVGAGVPLVTSLRTAREAIGNQTLADTVSHAIEEVQRGQALSKALAHSQKRSRFQCRRTLSPFAAIVPPTARSR